MSADDGSRPSNLLSSCFDCFFFPMICMHHSIDYQTCDWRMRCAPQRLRAVTCPTLKIPFLSHCAQPSARPHVRREWSQSTKQHQWRKLCGPASLLHHHIDDIIVLEAELRAWKHKSACDGARLRSGTNGIGSVLIRQRLAIEHERDTLLLQSLENERMHNAHVD